MLEIRRPVSQLSMRSWRPLGKPGSVVPGRNPPHPWGNSTQERDGEYRSSQGEALLAAIAIAQQQKAKSFELQAALSLAKLYQSTGHPGDAHVILATALEGFSPTPHFLEIAEAQTLLVALA